MDEDAAAVADENAESADAPLGADMVRVVGFDEAEIAYANGVYVAADPGALHLVFTRFVVPPVFTPADVQRITDQGFIPNQVVARVVVTSSVADQLLRILPDQIEYQRQLFEGNRSDQGDETEGNDASG